VGSVAGAVAGTGRSAAVEFDARYIPHIEGLDVVAHFHLDLSRRAAQIGSVDRATILKGDDVGVTSGRETESDSYRQQAHGNPFIGPTALRRTNTGGGVASIITYDAPAMGAVAQAIGQTPGRARALRGTCFVLPRAKS
jgi:hypothetical protein